MLKVKKKVTSLWEKIIRGRWTSYMSTLFEDHKKNNSVMKCNFDGVKKKKKDDIRQATDPECILVEHLEAIGDYGIDKITLLTKIYNTGQISPDISKSLYIAMLNKPRAIERSVL